MQDNQSRPKILLVQSDVLVRLFAKDVLEDEGFEVVGAATAAEALVQSEKELLEYSAAIINLGMPDVSGDTVARRLRAMRVDLPIVICSGRSEGELQKLVPSEGRRLEHLAKPFTPAFLLDALNRLGIAAPTL